MKLAPATLKNLANWIIHFQRRYQQYNTWVEDNEPAVIWLSGLHIPESYLTALVQATCRQKVPLGASLLERDILLDDLETFVCLNTTYKLY